MNKLWFRTNFIILIFEWMQTTAFEKFKHQHQHSEIRRIKRISKFNRFLMSACLFIYPFVGLFFFEANINFQWILFYSNALFHRTIVCKIFVSDLNQFIMRLLHLCRISYGISEKSMQMICPRMQLLYFIIFYCIFDAHNLVYWIHCNLEVQNEWCQMHNGNRIYLNNRNYTHKSRCRVINQK